MNDEILFHHGTMLGEYSALLERLQQTIRAAEERWPMAEEAIREGEIESFLKDFSPGVNSRMRAICRAAIDMLEFQHEIVQTRYSLLSFYANTGEPQILGRGKPARDQSKQKRN